MSSLFLNREIPFHAEPEQFHPTSGRTNPENECKSRSPPRSDALSQCVAKSSVIKE